MLRHIGWIVLALGLFFLVADLTGVYVVSFMPCLRWPLIWKT